MNKSVFLAIAIVVGCFSSGCGPSANNLNGSSNTNTNSNSTPALTTPTPATCTAAQNRAIIAAINNGVDTDLASIKSKINWHVENCSVFLSGYTLTIQNFKTLEKYALSAPAVATINNEKLWLLKGEQEQPDENACANGWSQCGDICIPPGQTCNNGSVKLGPSPSPKLTNKP